MPSKPLSLIRKLCYGFGGMPFVLTITAHSVFSTKYLLDGAKLPPRYVTIVLFIGVFFGAISDPIFAYLVDKTKVGKFGKLKPWIIVSSPICALTYVLLWYAPSYFSLNMKTFWLTFWNLAFLTVIEAFRIPHQAMVMYLTDDLKDRDLANIYRSLFEMVSILLSVIMQNIIIPDSSKDCEIPIEYRNDSYNELIKNITISTKNEKFFSFTNLNFLYLFTAILFASTFIIAQLLTIFCVNERVDLIKNEKKESKTSTFWSDLKLIITFRPFLYLTMAYSCGFLAAQSYQWYLQLYFEYSFYPAKDFFLYNLIVLLILSILVVPIWKSLMNKIGKKACLIIGNLINVPYAIALLYFNQRHHIIYGFILTILPANMVAVGFIVPMSALPECIDAFVLKHNKQIDVIIYTMFLLIGKIGCSIYLAISQYVLDIVGYRENVCTEYQPKYVNMTIRMLIVPVSIFFVITAAIFTYLYPINQKVALENSIKLKKMREKFEHSENDNENENEEEHFL